MTQRCCPPKHCHVELNKVFFYKQLPQRSSILHLRCSPSLPLSTDAHGLPLLKALHSQCLNCFASGIGLVFLACWKHQLRSGGSQEGVSEAEMYSKFSWSEPTNPLPSHQIHLVSPRHCVLSQWEMGRHPHPQTRCPVSLDQFLLQKAPVHLSCSESHCQTVSPLGLFHDRHKLQQNPANKGRRHTIITRLYQKKSSIKQLTSFMIVFFS